LAFVVLFSLIDRANAQVTTISQTILRQLPPAHCLRSFSTTTRQIENLLYQIAKTSSGANMKMQ
jgi:hypothetical protein